MIQPYKAWSLNQQIFSIDQSADALGLSRRYLRTLLQVFEPLFDGVPCDYTPLAQRQLMSYWDNLTIVLATKNRRPMLMDGDLFEALFDDLSGILPEESYKTAAIKEIELCRTIGNFLRSSHWEETLNNELGVEKLTEATVWTLRKLDWFVQAEAY